jgi:hemerythrin-like domain-containing protein
MDTHGQGTIAYEEQHGEVDNRGPRDATIQGIPMKPIGPLMWEHRTIERAIGVFDRQISQFREKNAVVVVFIDTATDFIRMYADRTHHGKEEDILFRDLSTKGVSEGHAGVMAELAEEHTFARTMTRDLVEARDRYMKGNSASVDDIISLFRAFADFTRSTSRKRTSTSSFPSWSITPRKSRTPCSGNFTSSTGK